MAFVKDAENFEVSYEESQVDTVAETPASN